MEQQVINIVKVFIVTALVLLTIIITKETYIDVDNHLKDDKVQQMEKAIVEHTTTIKMLNDYVNWKECMDSSNIDCQICDSLYNPDGEFVY